MSADISRHITVVFDKENADIIRSALNAAKTVVEDNGGTWILDPPDLLDDILSQMYAPTGETEDKIVKTSAELAYEVEDMVSASVGDVAAWLYAHKFRTIMMDGVVSWVLYEKNVSYDA